MMKRRLIDDCFRPDADAPMLQHRDAIGLLQGRISRTVGSETVPIDLLAGRTISQDATAVRDVPLHRNAAVDGFAFRYPDEASDARQSSGSGPRSGASANSGSTIGADLFLSVAGVAAAGHPFESPVPAASAVRILTGAVVPDDCDTVAMQEDCSVDAETNTVRIPGRLRKGANVRPAGEDVSAGETILKAGHRVRPQDLAALASLGIGEIGCYTQPRVAILSTGDELQPPGKVPLQPGGVYDANSHMLEALARSTGATPERLGTLNDTREDVAAAFHSAASGYDLILTSGGASGGSEDYVATVLDELGSRHFWRINVKPGRPILFGQIGDTVVVGLPGNPVAAFVCFHLYVWPMLRAIGGAPWPEPTRLRLPAGFAFKNRKIGRREYWRGWLEQNGDGGAMSVQRFPRDGSGLITSIRMADGLIEVEEDVGDVRPGDLVTYIPLSQFAAP